MAAAAAAAGGNGDPPTNAPVATLLPDLRNRRMRAHDLSQPMVLWQIDSWDKLAPFGFRVHGCIDAAAGIIVWAKVASDLRQETLYGDYKAAAELWGRPLKVRSNCTGSDKLVEEDIVSYRGHAVTKPFSRGPSIRGTERIEVWWSHMERVWGHQWNLECGYLVQEKWLDVADPWHMASLHATFFAKMEQSLAACVRRWNNDIVWRNDSGIRQRQAGAGERERVARPPRHAVAADGQGGWILLSDTEDLAAYNAEAGDGAADVFSDNPRPDSVRVPAVRPEEPLPQEFAQVRDMVYKATASKLEVAHRYRLHLALSGVCFKAWQTGMPLVKWLQTTDVSTTHPSLRAAALLISSKLLEQTFKRGRAQCP